MEKETFKITLADGTSIEGLTQNGNNFISETEIDETIFKDNCSPMTVESSGGDVTTYENGAFIQQTHYEGVDGYYLAFREKTAEEIKMETMQSQIDYLSMMTGIEI